MKKLNKIVFIDDDIPTNEYHKFIVKKADVARDSYFFTNAENALAYLSDIKTKYDFPDLIFIDIKMPGMTGHEFIDSVRSLPNFNEKRTELAYLATTMTNEDVAAYAANGMKYYYFKTITAVNLCKIVTEIFNIETVNKPVKVIDQRARRI